MTEVMERVGFPVVPVAMPPQIITARDIPRDLLGLPASFAQRERVVAFAQRDGLRLSPLLYVYPMPEVAALAFDLQDVPRKVSGEPYAKHVLRTVVLVSQEEVTRGLSLEDVRVLTAAAYLHDALELQRKKNGNSSGLSGSRREAKPYSEEDLVNDLIARRVDLHEARRIVSLVHALTPPKEGREVADHGDYLLYKVANFEEKFQMAHADARLLRTLKAADMVANMEETADDIEHGLDDLKMERPYALRAQIFAQCVELVKIYDPHNPLLPQLETALERLMKRL